MTLDAIRGPRGPAGTHAPATPGPRPGDPRTHHLHCDDDRRAPRIESRRRRTHLGPASRVPLSRGHPALGHGPPGLHPQTHHWSPREVREPAPARWPLGVPESRREPARLDRVQPRLDGPLIRPWSLDCLGASRRARRPRRKAPCRGRCRRRIAHRRNGLRGAQQPRSLESTRRDCAQRQWPQLRADGLETLGVPHVPATQSHVRQRSRGRAAPRTPPSPSGPRRTRRGFTV